MDNGDNDVDEMIIFRPGTFETMLKHEFVGMVVECNGEDCPEMFMHGLDITIDGDKDLSKANECSSLDVLVLVSILNAFLNKNLNQFNLEKKIQHKHKIFGA